MLRFLAEMHVPVAEFHGVDALAFAPDAEKVAGPWRELGRHDLTPVTLTDRLEAYLQALFSRYG
ncbi:2'-phosphotransferase [Streptomyces phaeochromogenes]|uniref:2'-phosphotransferase n=1 Tax=Streptomyces phaeochromogenes TaxID=1923 RepID=UPI003F4CEA0A